MEKSGDRWTYVKGYRGFINGGKLFYVSNILSGALQMGVGDT